MVINDISINTEAWYWIINWVWKLLVSVEILGASGRVADWVRFNLLTNLEIIRIEDKFVALLDFGGLEVGSGVNNVAIELWAIVVQDFLGWVDWGFLHLEIPLLSNDTFGNLEGVVVGNNVMVHSIVWNCVVNWIWEFLMGMLELSATS